MKLGKVIGKVVSTRKEGDVDALKKIVCWRVMLLLKIRIKKY